MAAPLPKLSGEQKAAILLISLGPEISSDVFKELKEEHVEQVAGTIRAALKHVAPEKLYPCTNCGMVPLSREIAKGKMAALAAGAALVRRELA